MIKIDDDMFSFTGSNPNRVRKNRMNRQKILEKATQLRIQTAPIESS